jgi:hypothetical protein
VTFVPTLASNAVNHEKENWNVVQASNAFGGKTPCLDPQELASVLVPHFVQITVKNVDIQRKAN